jgi:hypothetical protein
LLRERTFQSERQLKCKDPEVRAFLVCTKKSKDSKIRNGEELAVFQKATWPALLRASVSSRKYNINPIHMFTFLKSHY